MINDVDSWRARAFEGFGPLSFSQSPDDVKRMLGKPASDRKIDGFDPGRLLEYKTDDGISLRIDFDTQGAMRNISVAPLTAIRVMHGDKEKRIDAKSKSWHAVELGPRVLLEHGVSLFEKGGPRFSVSSHAYFSLLVPGERIPRAPSRKPIVEPIAEAKPNDSVKTFARRRNEAAKIMAHVAPKLDELAPFARPAFAPQWTNGDDDVHASKARGKPWLAQGEALPVCRNCKQPMQLALQIFSRDLPLDAPTLFEGVVQYFECGDTDCTIGDVPGTRTLRNAAVPADLPKPSRAVNGKSSRGAIKRITSWQSTTEYPQFGEEDETCDPGRLERAFEMLAVIFGDEDGARRTYAEVYPSTRTKLGGWPAWVQSADYPTCPLCKNGKSLSQFLQISDGDVNDYGTTFLFQCRKHPGAFAVRNQST